MASRFNCIEAYYTCLSLLCASGNASQQELSRQRSILCSFPMVLKGIDNFAPNDNDESKENDNDCGWNDDCDRNDDDEAPDGEAAPAGKSGYQEARLFSMPKGFFGGFGPGIKIVSSKLKIGSAEVLFIREHIGRDKIS